MARKEKKVQYPLLKACLPFLLVIFSGFLLLNHRLTFQPYLSQGDHGRDLYIFRATLDGQMAYRDYWWVYGPLMPYYYAAFFKILGVGIKSVLAGKVVLELFSGLLIFLILSLFIPPVLAYVGALWFWVYNPEFFFTYNHPGGITLLLLNAFLLCKHIKTGKEGPLYGLLAGLLALCLVKVNFGLSAMLVTGIFLAAQRFLPLPHTCSRKKFLLGFILLPFIVFGIYYLLLKGIPAYEIRQCLPYLSGDHPNNAPLWATLQSWIRAIVININLGWANRFFALILILCAGRTLYLLFTKKVEAPLRNRVLLALIVLASFYVLNLHEFLVSGVLYRTFWSTPFSILMIYLFIGFAMDRFSRHVPTLFSCVVGVIVLINYYGHTGYIQSKQNAEHFLRFDKGHIYTDNPPDWGQTVDETTQFLKSHLKDDETFFALPYEPLYYFLTDKPSPTRQLIFFEHINIPKEQERAVIRDLEARHVNTILISNRSVSTEAGMGEFGKTYCPLLGKYVEDNFEEIKTIGPWPLPAGWAWNHAVKIYQRKSEHR